MPPLPVISGKLAAKVFMQLGYQFLHQRGSHMIYIKPGSLKLSIPDHKTLDRGMLKRLIRDAGISVDEFVDNYKAM